MSGETIICRCEDVTQEEIQKLIEQGYGSMEELKRKSRCGMGPCQGRNCRPLVAKEIAKAAGEDPGRVQLTIFRPPTKPIKLGVLAGGDHDD